MTSETALLGIRNYRLVDEGLASSGQPDRDQLSAIAAAGYEIVINLALPTSDGAIAEEGALVAALGMSYVHIPVLWEAPRLADVLLFCATMQALRDRKIWVHCAYNMRVSCFLYLYRKHCLNLPDETARHPMCELWQPDGAWAELIEITGRHFRRETEYVS